jgi:hypothetical protein
MTQKSRICLAAMTIALVAMVSRMGWINWTLVAPVSTGIIVGLGVCLLGALVVVAPFAAFGAVVAVIRTLIGAPVPKGTRQ